MNDLGVSFLSLTPVWFVVSATAHRDVQRRASVTGICQRICKADLFDETFGVNSAFNVEVFGAAPHAVAMEFDLFGESGVVIGLGAAV